MSRVNPLSKHRLLYLGEISEPPDWLPSNAQSAAMSILGDSQIGMFVANNPSTEDIQYLENISRNLSGHVSVIKAGDTDFCIYIGPRDELCKESSTGGSIPVPVYGDFASAVERCSSQNFALTLRSGPFTLGERTKIMGILNVTPDSFSDGGRFHGFDAAVAQAERMAEEGADIIDVGGESTRPGSDSVPLEEEANRVLPVIKYLSENLSIPVSIDTCKAEIAGRALDAGADIVNDVSALRFDKDMVEVVRQNGCPLILMHMLGTPKGMQQSPSYDALMPEIISFLWGRINFAVDAGIKLEQLVVDPGIGFGKTVGHNLEILKCLKQMKALGRPILVGPSRKSSIGKVLEAEVDDRMEGTAAAVTVGIVNGAHMVRVHDVKEMTRVARMTDAIMGGEWD